MRLRRACGCLLLLACLPLLPGCAAGDGLPARFPENTTVKLIDWQSLYDLQLSEPVEELGPMGVDGVILDASRLAETVDGAYRGPATTSTFDTGAADLRCSLASAGISTDVLIGAPDWAGEDLRYLVERSVAHIAENDEWRRCPPGVVYLDIEPYGHGRDRERGLADLATTIEQLTARDPDVRLGVFVPAWLPQVDAARQGQARPFDRITRALRPGDLLAGMTYRRRVKGDNGLVAVTAEFVRRVEEANPDLHYQVGIETDTVDEPDVSFSGMSQEAVVDAAEAVVDAAPRSGRFEGVFVNSLASYVTLQSRS